MAADRFGENIPRRTFLGGLGAAAGSVLLQPPAGPADYYGALLRMDGTLLLSRKATWESVTWSPTTSAFYGWELSRDD